MSQKPQVVTRPRPAKKAIVESQPMSPDLAHGQAVIVSFRWILVLAGLMLAIWNPAELGELRIQIMVILLLAMANFYLQAQLLMRRPAASQIVYAASAADLIVITVLVIAAGGFDSGLYIFYFPAILAFSIAFPTRLTWTYVAGTIGAYTLVGLFTKGVVFADIQIIITRILMIVAVAFCGNQYRRIENERRQAAVKAQQELMAQVRRRQTDPAVQT